MTDSLTILQNTTLFQGFSLEEIQQALTCLKGKTKTFKKKSGIFTKEENLDYIGVVLKGNVLLSRENFEGNRLIFSELEVGEIFGETALSHAEEACGYEATAGSDCEVLFILLNKILVPNQRTCHLRSRIVENLMLLLLANNRQLYQKLDLVSHKSLRERALQFFQLQAKKNSSATFTIPFSRSELADYLTADRSALSRELQRMKNDGLIEFEGNQVTLLIPFE